MRFAILNAFVDQPMSGNPAAVCLLENSISDELMQKIAEQFGYSETAFVVEEGNQMILRWFTPKMEVDLCGHATMAAAYMIFETKQETTNAVFQTRSGLLTVTRNGEQFSMDFPARQPSEYGDLKALESCLETEVIEAVVAGPTVLALVKNQRAVELLQPNIKQISALPFNALIPTAKGDDVDFVSRFFGPRIGIPEDPVTGAAHTGLAPFWGRKLGMQKMTAKQLSQRGGKLTCEIRGDRTILSGSVQKFADGDLYF